MKARWVGLVVAVAVGQAVALEIETVSVGNPGNAADTRYETPGYGSVDYAYNIGKYEVTAGQYTELLNAVAGVDTYGLYDTEMWSSNYGCKIERYAGSGTVGNRYQYRVASDWANRPVNVVSWADAARFANWLHNAQPTGAQDLTTTEDGAYFLNGATTDAQLQAVVREVGWKWAITNEDEWYKPAYHKNDGVTGNYWDFPTGADSEPNNALVDPDPGNNATFYDDNSGYTIGSPYWRTEVGAQENSDSPYGTFDQGGNVWEWNESILYASYRGLRGGSFYGSVASRVYDLHAAGRSGHYPSSEEGDYGRFGFRVAEVPEPATLTVLGLGGLGVTRRRWAFSSHRRAT